jgi:hypothetical protein
MKNEYENNNKEICFEDSLKYRPVSHNTRLNPIKLTGLPLEDLPADNPQFLTDLTYYKIIDNLACNISIKKTLTDMGCDILTVGRVLRWILKDNERKAEYLESKAIGAELMAEEIIDISDLKMDVEKEDTHRSQLRIKARESMITHNNKERFGKEATVKVNVDLQKALEDASKRAKEAENIEVIDVDFEES